MRELANMKKTVLVCANALVLCAAMSTGADAQPLSYEHQYCQAMAVVAGMTVENRYKGHKVEAIDGLAANLVSSKGWPLNDSKIIEAVNYGLEGAKNGYPAGQWAYLLLQTCIVQRWWLD